MWRASTHDADQIRLLARARERLDLYPLAIHANYLINLASCEPVIRRRSIAAFRSELERASSIGAEYVVLHPGSYKGYSVDEAITTLAAGLHEAAEGASRRGVTVLLENTVGCGCQIGARFEELRFIRDRAAALTDLPMGYCLDTCHLLAAGFNIAAESGLQETVKKADSVLGLVNVRLIHANDSKAPAGSCLDRHAQIGQGYIRKAGFRRILAHPSLRSIPFILETPVEDEGDDRRNVEMLWRLSRQPKAVAKRGIRAR
jgi:deoxyribonuclease-4